MKKMKTFALALFVSLAGMAKAGTYEFYAEGMVRTNSVGSTPVWVKPAVHVYTVNTTTGVETFVASFGTIPPFQTFKTITWSGNTLNLHIDWDVGFIADGIYSPQETVSQRVYIGTDTDGDGVIDYFDSDADGNGVPDAAEAGAVSVCRIYCKDSAGVVLDVSSNSTVLDVSGNPYHVEAWPERGDLISARITEHGRKVVWYCVLYDGRGWPLRDKSGSVRVISVVPEWRKFPEAYGAAQ